MKALVTGASGFIGSTLIERLLAEGVEVRALLRKTSSTENLGKLPFERVEGDLADTVALRRAVRGVDLVFHLAGVVAARTRSDYFEANLEGTRRLAQAVVDEGVLLKRFVHVSSLAAGGPTLSPDTLRAETHSDEPVSAYGQSKLESEKALLQFRDRFPITIVRPPLVYGPKDKASFVFVQTVARGLMPLFRAKAGDGQKYYSSIHAGDLCEGIWLASGQASGMRAEGGSIPSGEVFYLAADGKISYEELMGAIAAKLGRKPLRFAVPRFALTVGAWGLSLTGAVTGQTYPLNPDKLNELFPDYWICSNDKARRLLGFRPRYDFANGIADAIEWYQKEKWI